MDGLSSLRRKYFEALFLGLIAAGACQLPPLQLAARLDRVVYDVWSRIRPPAPDADILLVRLDDPATFDELAERAHHESAQLLVTTLADPPSAKANHVALGPVELPVGDSRLRRTLWSHGGHLWFRSEIDGVVRHDWPSIDAGEPVQSLALHAAQWLEPSASDPALSTDAQGRRWLRFYGERAFAELHAEDLGVRSAELAGKILIADDGGVTYLTPVGRITTGELLAHALSGYRRNEWISANAVGPTLAWTLVLAALAFVSLKPPSTRAAWWLATAGSITALVVGSAAAFAIGAFWLPIVSPAIWLLATGVLTALRWPAEQEPLDTLGPELGKARRLAAHGYLEEAWLAYRQIPAGNALLTELYDLANALDAANLRQHASDLFHRIAQVDGHFRDVAHRLVRSKQSSTAPPGNAADRSSMPKTLGRYEVLEPIGRGAMGNVYLGRDPKINRIVAIKVIDLAAEFDHADLQNISARFLREAETAGRLSHPNIVTIFDVGEERGVAYIAMEYLRGRHLSEFAAPNTLLPIATVLDLLSRTADALHYAHGENVVHRDIKPANIMYDSVSDGLKITDFGIARLIDGSRTRTGIVLGTPAFMSPEQLEGKNVNGHTDLFALGVSLYQLLTGHLPFRGASMTKLMFVIANEPHQSVTSVRGDLPAWLDAIVDKALAKDPGERFQTGAEMAAALRYGAAQIV